jgi:hypothetical protein
VSERHLDDEDMVPQSIDVDGTTIGTDVIQADFTLESQAYDHRDNDYADRRGAFSPVVGGVQMQAQGADGVGTIGGLVERDGERLALTNEHVVGDAEPGDTVGQPTDENAVGTLRERTHAYDKLTDEPATADAALIEPAADADWSQHLLGIGAPQGFAEPEKYDQVRKSGRTTGVTVSGSVISLDSELDIKIGEDDEGNAIRQPVGPVLVSTLSTDSGDSGSLWVREDDDMIVGLHFAGGSGLAAAIPQSALHEAFGELSVPEEDTSAVPRWLSPRHLLRRLR